MAKKKFLKSKFYLVNPYKKIIKSKPFKTGKAAQREGTGKVLEKTFVGVKGTNISRLKKKGYKVV
tara:strand:+ start:185 stop:379 length:195 start_codon:yes stop_codon:yes gene_type:complete